MPHFTVWIVSPPGYIHSRCFEEVAIGLASGLRPLGHSVTITTDARKLAGRTIVLGANLLSDLDAGGLPSGSILFNLEQIEAGSPWMRPEYLDLLRRFPVLDFSRANIALLTRLGIHAHFCGIGYAPELTRIAPENETIDVLFYGSLNDRRARVLDEMRWCGLRVETPFNCYGQERDQLIARSKIVLNLHYYDAKVFEIVRVSYLLANRRCVLSEAGADAELEQPFASGIAFADYDCLVESAVLLATDPQRRHQLAENGFRLFSSHSQSRLPHSGRRRIVPSAAL